MKGSNKYNLLAKNESKKVKEQQEWVELQPISNWRGKIKNNEASYMKFQEEQSEIGHDNLKSNKVHEKQTIPSTLQNKNVLPSSNMEKRMVYLQNKPQANQSNFISKQQNAPKVQVSTQKMLNQQQSSLMNSQQIPPKSYQTQPSQNPYNNYNYNMARLQMPYNQSYPVNRQTGQQYQSQIKQPNMSSSNIKSSIGQPTRKSIPEMRVNCDKCTFTQSVPGNTQIYICCMCNEINECYPLYGVFTCGICRANVIYPHGTSRLIKCTKCQTVNKVNPQPSKKLDEVVTLGKEVINLQEDKSTTNRVDKQKQITTTEKFSNESFNQAFKIFPSQKIHIDQFDFFDLNNMPEINEMKRQPIQHNDKKQKLIDFEQFVSQNKQKCEDKELLELSERFLPYLRIEEQRKNQKHNQEKENQLQHSSLTQYPSIFDN